jgi:hypothetical protein
MTESTIKVAAAAAEALAKLSAARPELADTLTRVVVAVADEALRSPRFADSLTHATTPTVGAAPTADEAAPVLAKRSRRRATAAIDPFAVYQDQAEDGLRARLGDLNVDQLKDIIAEHGMDHDRLAMRWKTPKKLVDRIVEKVIAGAAKGSAFRQ